MQAPGTSEIERVGDSAAHEQVHRRQSRQRCRHTQRQPVVPAPEHFYSQKLSLGLFCKSQFPYKFVNLSFTITHIKNKLTNVCGN